VLRLLQLQHGEPYRSAPPRRKAKRW
jgi:hypothetical protein